MTIWTDDKIAELKRHHDCRLSASDIGRRMDLTRNAVLGKIHRLGLSQPGTPRRTPEQKEQKRQENNASRVNRQRSERIRERGVQEPTIPVVLPEFIGSLNIPFGDLRAHRTTEPNQCRYIAAEPAGPHYLTCGNETLPGESWCGHCKDVVFGRPMSFSDEDRGRRRSLFIKISNPSKLGRIIDDGDGVGAAA